MRHLTDSHKEQCKNISAEFMAWYEAVGNKLLAHNVVADETWKRYFETKNRSTRTTDGVASCEFYSEEEIHSCHFFMGVAWVHSCGHHAYKNHSQFKRMGGEINKASCTILLVRTLRRWLKFCSKMTISFRTSVCET
jgi:hypothetical protein